MDRSRRETRREPHEARREAAIARGAPAPPASSRLILRRPRNRRRPGSLGSLGSRLPPPRALVDACGRALRRSLPAAAAFAALVLLGGGLAAGYHWITRSPRFAVHEITIRGAHRVDPDQLRAALPVR